MKKTLRNLALIALVAAPSSVFAEVKGSGTAEDPYQIATKEDLCAANELTVAGQMVYFVQTADIDMAGVTDYSPFVGKDDKTYSSQITYDGRNHVIKNFGPANGTNTDGKHRYDQTVFGVVNGTIKNLGVIDAKITGSDEGAGILGAYAGHSSGTPVVVENVYVTGSIETSYYGGGMFGTLGNSLTVKNSFANVDIKGTGATRQIGGITGRTDKAVTLENVYVAGTVTSANPTVAGLISGGGAGSLTVNNVVVFNTGATNASGVAVTGTPTMANTDEAAKAAGIAAVQAWPAFSATDMIDGYPALAYQLQGSGTEADPYIIASADDLCNAYRFVDGNKQGTVYFKQTADIDMTPVEEYRAINGNSGAYSAAIDYDGQNHLITNFMPVFKIQSNPYNDFYYCTSVFGVLTGYVHNIGIVGAISDTSASTDNPQGAGILGAYGGQSNSGITLSKVDNVFVEGSVTGAGKYTGGMIGTLGTNFAITNSYANVTINDAGAATAGLVGRVNGKVLATENVYVAGTVPATAALVAAGAGTISAKETYAFNTGSANALASGIVKAAGSEDINVVKTEAEKAEAFEAIQEWPDFMDGKVFKGYPAFDWQSNATGISDIVIDNIDANAPAVYYNLQGVQVANPENGIYIVRRGNKVTKELVR